MFSQVDVTFSRIVHTGLSRTQQHTDIDTETVTLGYVLDMYVLWRFTHTSNFLHTYMLLTVVVNLMNSTHLP